MLYIELPPGVNIIKTDDDGFHCFDYSEKPFCLETMVHQVKDNFFYDEGLGLRLSITKHCPSNDKFYVEFLPTTDGPGSWCKVYNGVVKKIESDRLQRSSAAWVTGDSFRFLSSEKKDAVEKSRDELRWDRRTKGLKSV